jgi:hypothetical protein
MLPANNIQRLFSLSRRYKYRAQGNFNPRSQAGRVYVYSYECITPTEAAPDRQ